MRIDTFTDFNEFFEDFHAQLSKELGHEKLTSIAKKVTESKALNGLAEEALGRRRLPTGSNIVQAVTGARAFLFSGNKIILIASMVELAVIISVIEEVGIGFEEETKLKVAKQIFSEIREMS